MKDAYNLQQNRIGSAQQATVDRDVNVSKAVRWREEVLAVANMELADKPELRDKLGR
ncbi:MAG: hypothetical protein KDE52_03870 [Calditrichaeota bacterium]|nr:hypothetical protein [Calditrichota bacterium]